MITMKKCFMCGSKKQTSRYEDGCYKIECRCKNKVFGATLEEAMVKWNLVTKNTKGPY